MDHERITPIKLKIETPQFHSIFTPELNKLINIFNQNQYQIRIAGGAVRDLLQNKIPHDIDLATTATPDDMLEMFKREQIRILHKAGEKHGTVACRIDDKENFEVTTLRIDIKCDGRRADVAFTTEWQLDANRRDLTFNAMFLDFDGTVIDYFNGIEDLKNKRIRFVGDAAERISEDYLRILRYFRFYGRIADKDTEHNQQILKLIKEKSEGIASIAGERIWAELRQICTGRWAGPLLKVMLVECDLSKCIGLPYPSNESLVELNRVYDHLVSLYPEQLRNQCDPITLLCSLLPTADDLFYMNTRLKLSNAEIELALIIIAKRKEIIQFIATNEVDVQEKMFERLLVRLCYERHGLGKEINLTHVLELMRYCGASRELIEHIINYDIPKFPVDGLMVVKSGVKKGPFIKYILTHLFNTWMESDFMLQPEALLKNVRDEEAIKKVMEEEKQKREIEKKIILSRKRKWSMIEKA